jgi:DUF4097 and DUF4098 domain-containing protein YvlB
MFKSTFWISILCAAASHVALADQWTKSFSVGPKPELRVETSDGNVTLRTGSVSTIEARVDTGGWKIGPGEITVTSHQSGDRVELEVKIPSLHFDFGRRWVKIELQIPRETKADIHTGDGNIRADGLRGSTRLATHDGNIEGEEFDGVLEASSGDGSIHVRGRFDGLNLRSGDGHIDADVQPGSRMAGSWTVHSGDGSVTLRLPDGFAADIDAHTGDGRITVDLPLTTSGGMQEHSVSGKLNGGGSVLTIHTGDGSIHLSRL